MRLPDKTISSHLHRYACQTKPFPHIYTDQPAKANHFLTFTQIRLPNQTISSHLHRSACQSKPFPHIYADTPAKPNHFLTFTQISLPKQNVGYKDQPAKPPRFPHLRRFTFQTKPKRLPNQIIYFHMKAGSLAKP
jgi:hypothetical protein